MCVYVEDATTVQISVQTGLLGASSLVGAI